MRHLVIIFCTLFSWCSLNAQYITVDTNYTAEQLVRDIFFANQNAACISVDNIQISGWDFGNGQKSYGYFNQNATNFAMKQGILLSTGSAKNAIGPNTEIQTQSSGSQFYTESWKGDIDLQNALQISNTWNATILEFDFTSHVSDKISFNYQFSSEQYLRNGDPGTCGYTDGFAFLIREDNSQDYRNLAVIPNTDTPITSNTVRGSGGKCQPSNEQYFGQYNADQSPTNFNGETKILTAQSNVTVGKKYHLKIVIADQGNGLYDSGVFLEAGSFVGNRNLGPDILIADGNAICEDGSHNLIATIAGGSYLWYKDGQLISGATNGTYTVTETGFYEVVVNVSGCILKGQINIEFSKKPALQEKTIAFCDDNLDGVTIANLSDLSAQIITNNEPYFISQYFPCNDGSCTEITGDYPFTGNKDIFLRVQSGSCAPVWQVVHLTTGHKIPLKSHEESAEICDNHLSGNVEVNLNDYKNLFTNDAAASTYFYKTKTEAQNATNPIAEMVNISGDSNFFIRFDKQEVCADVAELKLIIKKPRTSVSIKDTVACPNSSVLMDAGPGFDQYTWSDGSTGQFFNASVGEWFVDLKTGDCVYRQHFSVKTAPIPLITNIEVNGSTATVFVSNGVTPYQYAMDGGLFQNSPTFIDLKRGKHTISVKSGDGCYTVDAEFVVLNFINTITPNGDGINDVLDYSDLGSMPEVSLKIVDRFGALVHQQQSSSMTWDGKSGGRNLPSGTYWYFLEWRDPFTNFLMKYQGWLLIKNRN